MRHDEGTFTLHADPRRTTVHAVLCASSYEDARAAQNVERLAALGYAVHLLADADCADAWRGWTHSNRTGNRYRLWGRRMRSYQRALARVPADGLVLFLDAFDVVPLGPAAEAERKFAAFAPAPLVVGCTVATWPPVADCPAYGRVRTIYTEEHRCRYPCPGAMIGRASAFDRFYRAAPFEDATNDQCWAHEVLGAGWRPGIDWALDVRSTLFYELQQDVTDWEAADRVLNLTGRPAFWSSGVQPTFVHLDGLHPTAEKAREVFMPIQQYVNVLPWLLP